MLRRDRLEFLKRKTALPAENQAHNVEMAGTSLAIWERLKSGRFDPHSLWRTVGEDLDLLRQLVRIFADEYPVMLKEIEKSAGARDAAGLRRATHKLKGSLLQFAAPAAIAAAAEIEQCATLNRLNEAESLIAKLRAETDSLLQLLQTMISAPIPGVQHNAGDK